uniref:Uncharacterized protein n=1 Tax=Rhizophora mucronata TaxID=61149 RepID=A0A2P2PRP7_RHIMU
MLLEQILWIIVCIS